MNSLLLQLLGIVLLPTTMASAMPKTFGKGIPNHPFTDVEVELFNHTLSAGSASGMVTHFWSTACGAGVSFKVLMRS